VLQGITVIGSGRRRVILQAVCKSGHGMPAGGSCRLAIAVRQSPTTSSGAVSTRLGRLLGLSLASNLSERPPQLAAIIVIAIGTLIGLFVFAAFTL
jgi:hypothetical protein